MFSGVSTLLARVIGVKPSKQQLTELNNTVLKYKALFDQYIQLPEYDDTKKGIVT
jgi:hypothetical protein